MQPVNIRPATVNDIPAMADLWQSKIVLQQQFDSRFVLAVDGVEKWSAAAARWLLETNCVIYVAEQDDKLLGYIIGAIQNTPPGLTPDSIGAITDLTLDVHNPQSSGLGRALLDMVQAWFIKRGIQHIVAQVPRRSAVEQAFWRGLGATEWIDWMWAKL